MIVILPGFGRHPDALRRWASQLNQPVEVREAPQRRGLTVDSLASEYAATVEAGSLVVGESFGGLVALAMAAQGYRAIALDPPFTTSKQWAMHVTIRATLSQLPTDNFAHDMAANVFGLLSDGTNVERNYYPLLDAIQAPADVITGDIPLWPPRAEALGSACCMDEIDRYIVGRNELITLHQVSGGHILLDANPAEILKIVRDRARG